jgi:hypothetical protein
MTSLSRADVARELNRLGLHLSAQRAMNGAPSETIRRTLMRVAADETGNAEQRKACKRLSRAIAMRVGDW